MVRGWSDRPVQNGDGKTPRLFVTACIRAAAALEKSGTAGGSSSLPRFPMRFLPSEPLDASFRINHRFCEESRAPIIGCLALSPLGAFFHEFHQLKNVESLGMAKNLNDLLKEWDQLIKKHRTHLLNYKFSNKFAVLSKEVDSLVVEFKTYSGLASEQHKKIAALNKQILAQVEVIRKKLKDRLTATKQEKENGFEILDDFCRCITHESDEVKPTLLGKEWVETLKKNKKNKAFSAVADDVKILSLLKKILDEGKILEKYENKLGAANAFANRKVKGDIEPDIERNLKAVDELEKEDKNAADEIRNFLKTFQKALDVVIY